VSVTNKVDFTLSNQTSESYSTINWLQYRPLKRVSVSYKQKTSIPSIQRVGVFLTLKWLQYCPIKRKQDVSKQANDFIIVQSTSSSVPLTYTSILSNQTSRGVITNKWFQCCPIKRVRVILQSTDFSTVHQTSESVFTKDFNTNHSNELECLTINKSIIAPLKQVGSVFTNKWLQY
jgi:hypothetical protein